MTDDYMNTRIDFLNATASYLGLPEDCLGMASSMHTEDNGCMVAVLHVHLSPRDMIGISKRMEAMAQMSNGIVTAGEGEKTEGRQVVHIGTPEEAEPTNMDAVWLPSWDVPDHMRQFASDEKYVPGDGNPIAGVRWFLMQSAMLTDEQKQKAKESKQ